MMMVINELTCVVNADTEHFMHLFWSICVELQVANYIVDARLLCRMVELEALSLRAWAFSYVGRARKKKGEKEFQINTYA